MKTGCAEDGKPRRGDLADQHHREAVAMSGASRTNIQAASETPGGEKGARYIPTRPAAAAGHMAAPSIPQVIPPR